MPKAKKGRTCPKEEWMKGKELEERKVLIIEQILHSFQEGHPNDSDGQQAELAAAGNRQLDWSEPWLGNK